MQTHRTADGINRAMLAWFWMACIIFSVTLSLPLGMRVGIIIFCFLSASKYGQETLSLDYGDAGFDDEEIVNEPTKLVTSPSYSEGELAVAYAEVVCSSLYSQGWLLPNEVWQLDILERFDYREDLLTIFLEALNNQLGHFGYRALLRTGLVADNPSVIAISLAEGSPTNSHIEETKLTVVAG